MTVIPDVRNRDPVPSWTMRSPGGAATKRPALRIPDPETQDRLLQIVDRVDEVLACIRDLAFVGRRCLSKLYGRDENPIALVFEATVPRDMTANVVVVGLDHGPGQRIASNRTDVAIGRGATACLFGRLLDDVGERGIHSECFQR